MAGKILIVDDEAGFIKVVGLIAEQLGMQVRATSDPLGAAAVFTEFRPDVVVIDMIMPGMDGIDVLNEILGAGLPVHVVLTSAFSDAYLRLGEGVARYHGIDRVHFLKKPFRRNELIALLTRLGAERPPCGASS